VVFLGPRNNLPEQIDPIIVPPYLKRGGGGLNQTFSG
jgi:hypothetical protein